MTYDEAVCVRHWDWSETSQTVSLFCRGAGMVRGLAKGSKREKAGFSGGIELATRGSAGMILKQTGAMATITSWELEESFPALRSSLKRFQAGMAMLELAHVAFQERDPHPLSYDALVAGLRGLAPGNDWRVAAASLFWAVLSDAGYRPELEVDVGTGEALSDARVYEFAPGLGGFTLRARPDMRAWKVRATTLAYLRRLRDGTVSAAEHAPENESEGRERGLLLLGAYTRECFASPLPALQMLLPGAVSS